MKIRRVSIQNFRSIKSADFLFPENNLLVLVGANNAGKSNIIRAIDSVCGESWFGPDKMEDYDYYLRDKSQSVLITLEFDNGRKGVLSSSERWPEYLESNGRKIYAKEGGLKDNFPCTYLGADRTFDKHMSFQDWTLIGKIRKAFHQQARGIQQELKDKYEELTQIFDKVVGFTKFKNDFSLFFNEMQADTPAKLSIHFKPFTPSNYFKTMQILAADPDQSNEPLDLSELGEGSRNTILLALLRSYALNFRNADSEVSGILALEEPEIFLHPQARRHLFKTLRDIANSGIQVVLSTHSSSFVDTEFFDSIGQVTKESDPENDGRYHSILTIVSKQELINKCLNTGVPHTKVDINNIAEFYKTTSNYRLNEGFFSRFLILVEGETEELALPEYLNAYQIECDRHGISIIAVQGKNQIPKYWRLFSLYKIPILVIFDNDNGDDNKKKTNSNIATCFGLNIDEIVNNVRIAKFIQIRTAPSTHLVVLEQDFETSINRDFSTQNPENTEKIQQWNDEARHIIKPVGNQNKGQIARYIARKIRAEFSHYKPSFIGNIANIISNSLNLNQHQNGLLDDDVPF